MKHLLPTLLLLTSLSFAQSSSEHFNFQGFHMIGGKPANGNFRVTFKVFDQISDGNELWTSGPIDDLPLVNGVYQRALGQNNGDVWGAIDWSVGNKFIEVTIGDVAKERTQLMAVPIAIGANNSALLGLNTPSYYALPIGSIVQSLITEAQFQTLFGQQWVLMDGRDISDSNLFEMTGMRKLPDARGAFLRGKNNTRNDGLQDPSGERVIGSFQNDQLKSHSHQIHMEAGARGGAGAGYALAGIHRFNQQTQLTGGSETRPKNIAINIFVKINN